MDFLCSNIPQVNDNVVVVKSDVTCTTTVSNMQCFFKYFSGFESVYNLPEPLSDKSITNSNQLVDAN